MKLWFFLLLIAGSLRVLGQDVGIVPGKMKKEGIDAGIVGRLEGEIGRGVYPNIHSLLIARHGKLVYERYWPGKDERLGDPLGVIAHGVDSLHDLRSVTKSFVGACIGIAIAEGKIKDVDVPVFSFFPEYARFDTGMKAGLTIRHLLTMSSGLDWDENRPYNDTLNSEIAMDRSRDPIGYVLSRPMVHVPGTYWRYNGGTTEVLAAIIQKVSTFPIDRFAWDHLFFPLGAHTVYWMNMPKTRRPSAAAGLRLRSRDMLKFGLLYANEGNWNGQSIIPSAWVDSSLTSHILRVEHGDGGYGFQFWTFTYTLKDGVFEIPAAVGNGDQRIFIDRVHDLVVVITSGKYNNWSEKMNANALMGQVYTAVQ
jgi:CubicO group peptidase (beta-lactamase class C family)